MLDCALSKLPRAKKARVDASLRALYARRWAAAMPLQRRLHPAVGATVGELVLVMPVVVLLLAWSLQNLDSTKGSGSQPTWALALAFSTATHNSVRRERCFAPCAFSPFTACRPRPSRCNLPLPAKQSVSPMLVLVPHFHAPKTPTARCCLCSVGVAHSDLDTAPRNPV